MLIYSIVVIAVVVLFSAALLFYLNRKKLLNVTIVLSMAMSSIVMGILFPFVWSAVMSTSQRMGEAFSFKLGVLLSFIITFFIYITLTVLLAIAISSFFTAHTQKDFLLALRSSFLVNIAKLYKRLGEFAAALIGKVAKTLMLFKGASENIEELLAEKLKDSGDKSDSEVNDVFSSGTLEVDYDAQSEKDFEEQLEALSETTILVQDAYFPDVELQKENILEKSVDTEQNIDKMIVETCSRNSTENDETVYISENNNLHYSEANSDNIIDAFSVSEEVDKLPFKQGDNVEEADDCEITDELSFEQAGNDQEAEELPGEYADSQEEAATITELSVSQDVLFDFTLKSDTPGGKNDYINMAFDLKESGDLEGAILYYLYALDANPEEELVFWIIVDICVLYKALGQQDLARDILQSYVNVYGNIMNESVRLEIEKNL